MREIVTINTEVEISDIRPLICELRGQAVMLDRDLASLYHVMTGRLNEAVKRNIARFPAEFMFQLSDSEMKELIANCDRFRMMKHSPSRMYAFTEQGVAMLSTVLKSDTAIRESIRIMKVRKRLRCLAQGRWTTNLHRCQNGSRNHPRTSRLNPQGDNGMPRIRQKQVA